jgi:hypothetical protein
LAALQREVCPQCSGQAACAGLRRRPHHPGGECMMTAGPSRVKHERPRLPRPRLMSSHQPPPIRWILYQIDPWHLDLKASNGSSVQRSEAGDSFVARQISRRSWLGRRITEQIYSQRANIVLRGDVANRRAISWPAHGRRRRVRVARHRPAIAGCAAGRAERVPGECCWRQCMPARC